MVTLQIADVNWLLSALSQSAAALIAIVGGLLVSRYVALHAEQQAARRRVEDLARRGEEVGFELAGAQDAVDAHQVEDALDDPRVFDEIVKAEFEPSVERVLTAIGRDGADFNLALLKGRLAGIATDAEDAARIIAPLVETSPTHDDWDDVRRAHGLRPVNNSLWEWLYDEMCEAAEVEALRIETERYDARRKAAAKDPMLRASVAFSMPPMRDPRSIVRRSSHTRLIRSQRDIATVNVLESAIADAQSRLRALEQEGRLAAETYEATRQPEGFQLALQVIAVLALFGMAVPVIVMAFGPMTLPMWGRTVTVAIFLGAVGLLLRFLFVYASYLREGGRDSLPASVFGLLRRAAR